MPPSSPTFLLDTNIILNLVRANPLGQYIQSTFELSDPALRPLTSIVVHGELAVMASSNKWGPKKIASLAKALDEVTTIPLDSGDVIDAYVTVRRTALAHPAGARAMSDNDAWIAACAIASDAVLLTTDKDFLYLNPFPCKVHWVDPTLKP